MDSATITNPTRTQPLPRLTFCPRCDYLLRGLGDEGNCPECGTPFDQKFIVLRTRPVMSGANPNSQAAFSAKRCWWAAGWVVAALVWICVFRSLGSWTLFFGGIGFTTINLLLELIVLFTAIRPGEILVWCSVDGVGQQQVIDPGAALPKLSRWIGVAMPLVLVASSWRGLRHSGPAPVGMLVVLAGFLVLVPIAVWMQRRKAVRFAVTPEGVRPGLLPWSAYSSVEWNRLGGGRFELLAYSKSFVAPAPAVHVIVELPADEATGFEATLDGWTSGWKTLADASGSEA